MFRTKWVKEASKDVKALELVCVDDISGEAELMRMEVKLTEDSLPIVIAGIISLTTVEDKSGSITYYYMTLEDGKVHELKSYRYSYYTIRVDRELQE